MNRGLISKIVLIACLVCVGDFASACSGAGHPALDEARAGSLAMPLVTTVNGSTYRLSATLFISGPTFSVLTTTEDPGETALRASLQTGTYFASLSGWTLQKQRGDGTFAPVMATLTSNPSPSFTIQSGASTTIAFQFETDGIIVQIGQGSLVVDVDVEETAPLCNPLGSNCAEGFWCPPTGLTGAPIACVPAGSVAVGQPCLAPTDCVANASCIDTGTGPVCTALCLGSAVGEGCDSGGTCQAAGTDYGVCR